MVETTRKDHGNCCPIGFTGNNKAHVWIETTAPGRGRTFSCDYCSAKAVEETAAAIGTPKQRFNAGQIKLPAVSKDGGGE